MPKHLEEIGLAETRELNLICTKCKDEFPVIQWHEICPVCGNESITFIDKVYKEKTYVWTVHEEQSLNLKKADIHVKEYTFNPIKGFIKFVKMIKNLFKRSDHGTEN